MLEELGGSGLDEALDPLGGLAPVTGILDHAVGVVAPAADVVAHDGVRLVIGVLIEGFQVSGGLLGGEGAAELGEVGAEGVVPHEEGEQPLEVEGVVVLLIKDNFVEISRRKFEYGKQF